MSSTDATSLSRRLGTASFVIGCVGVIVIGCAIAYVTPYWERTDRGKVVWSAMAELVSGVALLVCGVLSLTLGIRATRQGRGRGLGIAGAVIGGLLLVFLVSQFIRIYGNAVGIWAA